MAQWDLLIRNVNLATCDPDQPAPYGTVKQAALAIRDGKITWIGAESALPAGFESSEIIDGQGQWLLPGFIDCHTHLIYGGNRAQEFEQRLSGVSYAEIAAAGGGIASTVRATREASVDELVTLAIPRLQALLDEGVTGIEIKSGYGLSLESERRMLQAATKLAKQAGIPVQRTFLGAHALPPEYAGQADGYVDVLCGSILPTLAKENLVDAVDGFCETIAFSTGQIQRVFETAQQLGLPVKLHAEQLTNQSGAALVAAYRGLSADHLEYLDQPGIQAMQQAGTCAVLLPGAYYFLRETRQPPIQALREAGVPIALATDANPGSSPLFSLRLILNMACTLWGMTPEEALLGITRHAAQALGWQKQCGTLSVGKQADMVLWPISSPADLAYQIGGLPPSQIWLGGQPRC